VHHERKHLRIQTESWSGKGKKRKSPNALGHFPHSLAAKRKKKKGDGEVLTIAITYSRRRRMRKWEEERKEQLIPFVKHFPRADKRKEEKPGISAFSQLLLAG